MSPLDWGVLAATLLAIVVYGVFQGRRQKRLDQYLLADRKLHRGTVAISVMATQASAITFLSTPGQAYADGMRFVQFYFGLPIAMVLLSAIAVPVFHRMRVFTAYEYLETRFDVRVRTLTAVIFLVQRGLGTAMTLYAPALILSLVLGWSVKWTAVVIGLLVVVYTTSGGAKAVAFTQRQQLLVSLSGMALALFVAFRLLPSGVGAGDAVALAGRLGRIAPVDFRFDATSPYNVWSGLFGGLVVALAYFGTDQSQVQRYLGGETETESRLALLINGLVKVPMQAFILFVGAMVFVFYVFAGPPLSWNPVLRRTAERGATAAELATVTAEHDSAVAARRTAALDFVAARRSGDAASETTAEERLRAADGAIATARKKAVPVFRKADPAADAGDSDYVFLTFVTKNLPVGAVGLLLAAILCAAMSATASGLSALASTSVVDVAKRLVAPGRSDADYVRLSRTMTIVWGVLCVGFALFANRLGSLIVAVNKVGSLFYGAMLAIFLVAFHLPRVGATAMLIGALAAEAAVAACAIWTPMAWLWWNVVGCVVGVVVAVGAQAAMPRK